MRFEKVNNAAIVKYGSIWTVGMDQYDELMRNNLTSAVLLTKHATPHLIKTKGSNVNFLRLKNVNSQFVFVCCCREHCECVEHI